MWNINTHFVIKTIGVSTGMSMISAEVGIIDSKFKNLYCSERTVTTQFGYSCRRFGFTKLSLHLTLVNCFLMVGSPPPPLQYFLIS